MEPLSFPQTLFLVSSFFILPIKQHFCFLSISLFHSDQPLTQVVTEQAACQGLRKHNMGVWVRET